MIALFLLLLSIVAVSGRLNACGSNVTEYDNYLDLSIDVPLELVADMIVGNMKPNPFKDLHDPEYYQRYVQPYMTPADNVGNWTKMPNGIRSRTLSQLVESEPPLRVDEIQRINDDLKLVEVVSTITLVEPIVIEGIIGQQPMSLDFEIVSRTCLSPNTRYQVDMQLIVPENYREMQEGNMRTVNKELEKVLRRLELVQQNYHYDFKFNNYGYIRQKSAKVNIELL